MKKFYPILLFLFIGCTEVRENSLLNRFEKYYSLNRKGDPKLWNYAADTIRIWFDNMKGKPVLKVKGKKKNGKWSEWDKIMNSKVSIDTVWQQPDSSFVRGLFLENNDFYELLGKEPTITLRTYYFNSNNEITDLLIYWLPDKNIPSSIYLEKVAEWALIEDSALWVRLYPNNTILPSKENALLWKDLLRRYNLHNGK